MSNGIEVLVEFPRIFSEIERNSILGNEVKYTLINTIYSEGSLGDLLGANYELELLAGKNKGKKIKEEIVT